MLPGAITIIDTTFMITVSFFMGLPNNHEHTTKCVETGLALARRCQAYLYNTQKETGTNAHLREDKAY